MKLSKRNWATPTTVALVAALLLGALTWKKFVGGDAPDLRVFYVAGQFALSEPAKIYHESPDRFLYPPFAALLFAPLGALDWNFARCLWYGLVLVAFFLLARRSWAQLFAALILWRYFAINLRYGQVNVFLLLAMYGAHTTLRRGRWESAGALLAFTSLLKVFPAVQGVDMLLRREWRAIAAAAAAALALALLPFLAWGPEAALQVYADFPAALAAKGVPVHSHNQSFLALLLRFLHADSFFAFPVGWTFWRIAELPLIFLNVVALALGITLAILAWRKAAARANPLDTLAAAGFSVLFLSHIVWKPYIVLLLPALSLCLRKGDRTHGTLLALFMLCGPFLSAELYGKYASYAEGVCVHLFAAIFLFAAWWRLPKWRSAGSSLA